MWMKISARKVCCEARQRHVSLLASDRPSPNPRLQRTRLRDLCAVLAVALNLMTTSVSVAQAQAQATRKDGHDHRLFPCLEDGLKSNEFGCQLLGKLQVSRFPDGPVFWHLSKFPTREAAEAAKSGIGLVVEAEGKFWLFSFGAANSAPKQGERVASVGPLELTSNRLPFANSYEVVAYLAVMPPKTYTRVHTHPGPEAWYVLAGEQCLETPGRVIKARTGEGAMAPPATPMQLTNDGSSVRRALFIVIHDAAQPWSIPTEEWKPSGACDQWAGDAR